jgi:cell division protein FtsB
LRKTGIRRDAAKAIWMATRRRTGIRWDRLGRVALLGTLLVIVFSYASPARQWIKQSGTASHQKQQLSDLGKENRDLRRRLRNLRDPGALEREARRLGMVRVGERSYVIENLP